MVVNKFLFLFYLPQLHERSIDRGNSSNFVVVVLMIVMALVDWGPGAINFITFALSTNSIAAVMMLVKVVMMLITGMVTNMVVVMMVVVVSKSGR